MKIIGEEGLDFSDVLIVPQWTQVYSREHVNLNRKYRFYHSPQEWEGVPIMVANMDGLGCLSIAKALHKKKIITCLSKFEDDKRILEYLNESHFAVKYVWYSLGMDEEERCAEICNNHINNDLHWPNFCVDVANGHNNAFAEQVARYREISPSSIIMAGNVTTSDAAQRMIDVGKADIAKVGIGPGSHCSTRRVTGIGVPQLTAVMNTSHMVHGMKTAERRMGLICSDGGCRTPGDVSKAFAANSDFVMLGGFFAGAEECEGNWWIHQGEKHQFKFYGSSSKEAQEAHDNYKSYRTSEGTVTWIDNKGPIEELVGEIEGGVRSTCAYVGANCLKDLPKCAQFIKVRRVHDLNV